MKPIFGAVTKGVNFNRNCCLSFIGNGSRFIFSSHYVWNTKTWQTLCYNSSAHSNNYVKTIKFFDTGNYLIASNGKTIDIYNADSFEYLKNIDFFGDIMYHSGLNLLIMNKITCYRLDLDFELRRIKMGFHYQIDCAIIHNQIMDILLLKCLLFDLLPLEIVCIELYGKIIKLSSYSI